MKHMFATLLLLLTTLMNLNTVAFAAENHYARGQVIIALQLPNKLGVSGREFKTMNNPKGEGVFVYDPRTRFHGVERNLVWLVIEEKVYPLNSASKILTPSLKWPREADPTIWKKTKLDMFSSEEVIKMIFGPK